MLTNTLDVRLWKVPKSRYAEIAKLYAEKQWAILGQIWNQCEVSPTMICNGCPDGIYKVKTFFKEIADLHQDTLEAEKVEVLEQIEPTPLENLETEKPTKRGKNKSIEDSSEG
jgi:hypothetical protein